MKKMDMRKTDLYCWITSSFSSDRRIYHGVKGLGNIKPFCDGGIISCNAEQNVVCGPCGNSWYDANVE